METTLFIEMTSTSAKIALYDALDKSFQVIDITGGYGKEAIPLQMHYIREEETWLVGEDAIQYEVDETTVYYQCVAEFDLSIVGKFIEVLVDKVQGLIPHVVIGRIEVVTDNEQLIEKIKDWFHDHSEKSIQVKGTTFLSAMCGWALSNKQENGFILYCDDLHMLKLSLLGDLSNHDLKSCRLSKSDCDLISIDSFYLDYLESKHLEKVNQHDLYRLYYEQMVMLFSQITKGKEASVYSSLVYPPMRIRISQDKFKSFIEQFHENLPKSFLDDIGEKKHDRIFYAGAYDKSVFIRNWLESMVEKEKLQYEEHLILKGAYEYVITYHRDLPVEINNQSSVILIKDNTGCKIELPTISTLAGSKSRSILILTKDVEKLNILRVMGEEEHIIQVITIPKLGTLQRMYLEVEQNHEGQIEEVNYEFRNL